MAMLQFLMMRRGWVCRSRGRQQDGFTLIETLIVIVVIGLLGAIALPSFMGQIHKAKETEAKVALDFLKKSQYGFYLENNEFARDLQSLNFSLDGSKNYSYRVIALEDFSNLRGRLHLAFSKQKAMRSYGSVVYLQDGQLGECALLSDTISEEHSISEQLQFIFDAIQYYERYCS